MARKTDSHVTAKTEPTTVDVRWHSGEKASFDFVFHDKAIRFVDGVATVTPDVADALREKGCVK